MGFGTNYKAVDSYDLIPVGEYECIITNGEIRQLQSGAWKVAFTLTIRNDVQQQCADRILFVDIWRKKEPNENDAMVDGFNFAQLMAVARAAQIPDGANFETLQQFISAMVGRLVRASVTHHAYNGKTYEDIDQIRGLAPTKFPECRHVQKQKPAQNPAYSNQPAPRQNQGYAQRPSQQYAQSKYTQTTDALGTPYRPPRKASAPAPVQPPASPLWTQQQAPAANAPAPPSIGSLDEFEDILQDGELPF